MKYTTAVVAMAEFGRQVAERLRVGPKWVHIWSGGPLDLSMLPLADNYVLAAGHPCPEIEIELSRAALDWGRRFVPVVHEHPYVRSGPISSPGALACSWCYERRLQQHTNRLGPTEAVTRRFISEGPTILPQGLLPVWAELGAGLVELRLGETGPDSARRNAQMLGVDLMSSAIIRSDVIGVDGCPVCHRVSVPAVERSIAGLSEIIRPVLEGSVRP